MNSKKTIAFRHAELNMHDPIIEMPLKDENEFLEKINAIIPILNGYDPAKLASVDYTGIEKQPAKSKHCGVKVMTKIRYLILLHVAGQVVVS